WITTVIKPAGPVLVVHYLRLKGSATAGLVYTPEFSSTPDIMGGWSTATGPETVEFIDSDWERVTVEDAASPFLASRFARLRVSLTP
ncbi:MAG: hypothetical protein JWM59_312, partial [Verrucomicrobiales bacterium]|nr:hypothetical protein [Verrucomicrobiales bacterium]